MFSENALAAKLALVEPIRRSGYATRFIQEQYRATALSAIGALKRGGRYNPPGIAALYTSLQRSTALREATSLLSDEDPTVPHLMLTIEYDIARLLDLTDRRILHRIGTTRSALVERIALFSPGLAPTQVLGRAAHTAGFQGILAFSRPERNGTNLIILTETVRTGDYAIYDDPPGRFEELELVAGGNVIRFPHGGPRR